MASPTLPGAQPEHGETAPASTVVRPGSGEPAPLRDTLIGRRWAARWRSLRGVGGLRILGAVAAGLLMYLGAAPRTWWWSPILGLAVFGLVLHGRRTAPAIGLSLLTGLAYFVPLLNWTGIYVGATPWLALATAEALLVMPTGALIAAAGRLAGWPWFAAGAWVLGETLRAYFPFGGFPWGTIAFTQPDGPLLPSAALIGAAGLSYLTALAGFGLSAAILAAARRRPRELIGAGLAVAVAFAIGLLGLAAEHDTRTDPPQVVALIQGNVPRLGLDFNAQRRAVLDNHAARTHELAEAVRAGTAPQPAFVIWPENSSDIDPYRNADAAEVIDSAARDIGVPILVGAVVLTDTPGQVYNMGIVWDPVTGPGQAYIKRHPVPFAEYMPWRSVFRLFSDKVDLLQGQFLPGSAPGNLIVAGTNVGDVICFEIVEDGLVRDVVNGGAQVLVVQTNNATFGLSAETWQQQAMSRVRAVEHGRDVLIAATSGVSAVIRSDGSVEARLDLFTPGYLTPTIGLADATTPGTVIGEPLRWILTLLAPLGLLVAAVLDRRGSRRAERAAASPS